MVKAQLSILDEAGSESGLGSIQGVQSINQDNKTEDSSLPHLMLHDREGDMDCTGPWGLETRNACAHYWNNNMYTPTL